MSEEIDLDANNLSISDDAFEQFHSTSAFDEDEFIELSDIVPPQPSVPDLSQELNEIPFDNEVVLGSPSLQNIEDQVNSHTDTGSKFFDISENNVCQQDTSGEGHTNDLSRDLEISNSRPKRQKEEEYYDKRPDLSSDGLGSQNYVFEDSSSIIQDSLLTTTVGQSDTTYETPSEDINATSRLRRTKRGRILNTSKYPMTSASSLAPSKTTHVERRRPGRPKKVPLVQATSEPDSTNEDNFSLSTESENVIDGSGLGELTPSNSVKRGRRCKTKYSLLKETAPTPSKRGRKPKTKHQDGESLNNCHINENTPVEFTKEDDNVTPSQIEPDCSVASNNANSVTLSTSKRKKPRPKKGNKAHVEATKQLETEAPPATNTDDIDDEADDVCLSKLKDNLNLIETEPKSTGDVLNEAKPLTDIPLDTEGKPSDQVHIEAETELVDSVNNGSVAMETEDLQNNVNSKEVSGGIRRNSKMPVMTDFEYNVDKVVKEATADSQPDITAAGDDCLLVEDTSKRRRTAKKSFVYDEGSDEDPFANMESSDEEPKRRKKGGTKYYSDDEYVPDGGKKRGGKIRSSSSESEDELNDDELMKPNNKNIVYSPFKRGRKPLSNKSLVSTIKPKTENEGDDIEVCLETTMIQVDETLKPPAEAWATSNEFENFIAQKTQGTNLKIKKVSSKETTDTLAPLDIPVVKQNERRKTIETSTQTSKASSSTISVQTSAPYDIPMKTNIHLTASQSEKACEFLSSVVKTTVELGQLMSQKSNDFMNKKINTEHVTDTFKMDYCVRKSFLLFKLAKHNLLQMEEDLANQYDAFLQENNLSSCREIPKSIISKAKADSDSDCEIVEVVGSSSAHIKKPDKSKFNPKTVFLNKELSIKIAKKPSAPEDPVPGKKKLEMKGRHAVWINKNVMVKKVTPTQSFLAQDSRNKKPPDTYVTEKMVSDFFEDYHRSKALLMCAPFLKTDWTRVTKEFVCHYFVSELDATSSSRNTNDLDSVGPTENGIEAPDENRNIHEMSNSNTKSLLNLCIEIIRICLHGHGKKPQALATQKLTCNVTDGKDSKEPVALFRLCVNALRSNTFDKYMTQKEHDTVQRNNLRDQSNQNNMYSTVFKEMNDLSDQYYIEENNINDNFCDISCQYNIQVTGFSSKEVEVLPLKTICYKHIRKYFSNTEICQETIPNVITERISVNNIELIDGYYNTENELEEDIALYSCDDVHSQSDSQKKYGVKSLITLCVDLIQSLQRLPEISPVQTNIWHPGICELKSLKSIALDSLKQILYPCYNNPASDIVSETSIENETLENFTINCVSTLSEEAFQSLQIPLQIRIRKQSQDSSNFSDGFDNDGCVEHDEMDSNANHETDDTGWASQLQMQEFRSCFTPPVDTPENMTEENNETVQENIHHPTIPQIKSEPIDDFPEENFVDTSIVKTESLQTLHASTGMTHIPDNIIAKKELTEVINDRGGSPLIRDQSTSSFNVESFENFVRTNKMLRSMNETNDEIFSQSGLRIRRQHEPDVDQGHDTGMSLLVPHTFEPLQLVEAKTSLMESSSDDGNSNYKKNTGKKKDKKKKKTKKDAKTTTSKETPAVKDKIQEKAPENEVAILTRKMKEKIRQEEKKIESSDSDSENLYMLSTKKDKNKKGTVDPESKKSNSSDSESDTLYMFSKKDEKTKHNKKDNDKIKEQKNKNYKEKEDVVQCNNVDSTDKGFSSKKTKTKELDKFSGFTAIDQNEMTNYQKLMQYVYDKIIPSGSGDIVKNPEVAPVNLSQSVVTPDVFNDTGPIIQPDEPVELLECEPTMPIFDTEPDENPGPKKTKIKDKKSLEVVKDKLQFTDRYGWHCYPIDIKDTKIYSNAQIKLEKLPESFVETYMEYQDVMDKDLDDQEVDRLINLQSLNRSISVKEIKDLKPKSRLKGSSKELNFGEISNGPPSPTYSDNFDELVPSDDEGPSVADEIPPPMPARSSENNMAKNLLMDDPDSDSDGAGRKKIKQELPELDGNLERKRPGPKSKTKINKLDSGSLMLTADKMMNKELTLLHAPIVLQDDVKGILATKEASPKDDTKTSKRSSTKQSKDRVKNDDDSSSEEEKQWVSTKEKLLKRLGKKEDAVADDAKRAKLVNEFIERRNESDRKNKRESGMGRKGRARRKRLERQKQLRFLSNELYNEGDGISTGKRGAAAGLFKGRRNIRKVIDKKSLARSTVVANMEEFERKRRLNMRQNKLREVLGCEEGVNLLVINDEVCLEYNFEEQRPVVSVHQFFTKVMKAHQYEGVKFMWDACFESLDTIERGHGGGGCILAHCMGLGKTLQVLALLHTVLTHPRANMHRVLVCCPLSTVLNWVDEIHKWIGPVTHEIKVFELSKLRKTYERAYQLEDWYSGGGIFIIGYELFRSLTTLDPEIDEIRPTIINKIRTALLDPGPDIIVCDEGHLLKNDCSVLAVAMSRVVTKRRIVLTGTPMQNNLREYFCMVNFIKPNLLGTYSEYSNRFENPIMNGQHRDSVDQDIKLMKARTHILHKVLEGCLQRQEASVLYPYLPKKHEYTVFIPLTQCQWDLYNHYMSNYARTTKQSVLRDFHILQKIWSHPQVLHSFQMKARDKKDKIKAEKIEDDLAIADQEADIKPAETEVWWLQYLNGGAMLDSLDSSNKFVAVFRILHECVALGDKVLIFSTSLFCLDGLEYFLKKINNWSLGQEYYRLDGSVPAEVRQKWCREFNAENNVKTKLFLISTRAGCLGLNMTAANRVIILDTSWNPAHDIQSIFRVYRFGQKKDCYIYRLVAMGTMEQKIYERSVTKQAVACRVVDEQQIDRHYNLAELTELYSVDEKGLSVAGGVAVGIGDVALLRVARDAAIHAVHEHDSLLRGSSEQNLPEHERAAAWNQFQQEHEHKQMQNDLSANRAVVALKRLEMEHLRQQALYSTTTEQNVSNFTVKSEPSTHTFPLDPTVEEQPGKNKGKKHKRTKIVQCRIPIASGPQPGPSTAIDFENQTEMVQKITNLLIKHNFIQNRSGPKQISELVAKVKRMVATGQPMALGPGYDELSSSIANVLLHREVPMPPLTNVEIPIPELNTTNHASISPAPEEDILTKESFKRKYGRKPRLTKKQIPTPESDTNKHGMKPQVMEEEIPTLPIENNQEADGRMRRKAALAAEMQFQAERDVIDLDAIDCDAQDYEYIVDEPVVEPPPAQEVQVKKEQSKKANKAKEIDTSILLSDDDAPPEVIPPAAPVYATTSTNDSIDSEVVSLHPSLLTNSNFIKIVAHTYLAGNPMMDEDAATLAAQYSTLKTLKEAESEGKPIVSGAVYDIAIKVLGKEVLKKLQAANPKTSDSSCAASNKMQSLLNENSPESTPAPAVKKPKIGPKSKVVKKMKEEPTDSHVVSSTKDAVTASTGPLRVSKSVFAPSTSATFGAPHMSVPREESILPDEEVVSQPTHELPPDRKPIILRKVLIDRKSLLMQNIAATALPVSFGRGPAPQAAPPQAPPPTTICLDSDEEEAPADPAPQTGRRRTIVQMPTMYPSPQLAPVPVALTGPRPGLPRPQLYTLSACGTCAFPVAADGAGGPAQPIAFVGPGPSSQAAPSRVFPGQGRQPVPVSLVGPDSQPIPIALGQPAPQPQPQPQPVPMSLVDSVGRPVTMSTVGMRLQSGPLTLRFDHQQSQPPPSSPALATPSPPAPDVSAPPTEASAGPIKPSKPGDRLKIQRDKLTDILKRKKAKQDVSPSVRSIADSPPPLTPKPTPKPPPKLKAAAPSPPPPPPAKPQESSRPRRRRSSSSSSSSSSRSRSSSPDPLAILKDVVHIQAPFKASDLQLKTSVPPKPAPPKPAPPKPVPPKSAPPKPAAAPKKTNSFSVKGSDPPPATGHTRNLRNVKKNPPGASVDLTKGYAGPSKSNSSAKKQISASVDLTSAPGGSRSILKSSYFKDSSAQQSNSSKTSYQAKDSSKPSVKGNKPTANPSAPSKLVGTSKSIILDGRSKSLKIETQSTPKTIQVTSSKVIQSASTSKPKQADKRSAPTTSAPDPKKKKTELMTLKDFDIDDIDDIIELD